MKSKAFHKILRAWFIDLNRSKNNFGRHVNASKLCKFLARLNSRTCSRKTRSSIKIPSVKIEIPSRRRDRPASFLEDSLNYQNRGGEEIADWRWFYISFFVSSCSKRLTEFLEVARYLPSPLLDTTFFLSPRFIFYDRNRAEASRAWQTGTSLLENAWSIEIFKWTLERL